MKKLKALLKDMWIVARITFVAVGAVSCIVLVPVHVISGPDLGLILMARKLLVIWVGLTTLVPLMMVPLWWLFMPSMKEYARRN